MTYLNRQLRARADRLEEALSDARAAAGVDHRDAVAADDEARIGGVALVARGKDLVAALVDENAGRDLLDFERLGPQRRRRGPSKRGRNEG